MGLPLSLGREAAVPRCYTPRVTFWALTDADAWLNGFPVPGRVNHSVLWDRDGKPKPAFEALLKALQSR